MTKSEICVVCGDHTPLKCKHEISSSINCGMTVCSSNDCIIKHMYKEHAQSTRTLARYERSMGLDLAPIFVARISGDKMTTGGRTLPTNGQLKIGILSKHDDTKYAWHYITSFHKETDTLSTMVVSFINSLHMLCPERKIYASKDSFNDEFITAEQFDTLTEVIDPEGYRKFMMMLGDDEMYAMAKKMSDNHLLDVWKLLEKYPDLSEMYNPNYSTWTMEQWAEAVYSEKNRRGL